MDSDNFDKEDYSTPVGATNQNGMNRYYVDLQSNYIPAQGMVNMNQNPCNCHLMPWNYDYVQNSFYDGLVNTSYAYNPIGTQTNHTPKSVSKSKQKSNSIQLSESNGLNDSNSNCYSKEQASIKDGNEATQHQTSGNDSIEKAVEEFAKDNQPLYLDSISANYIQEGNEAIVTPAPLSALLDQVETASTTSETDSPPAEASETHAQQKHMMSNYSNGLRMNMLTVPRSQSAIYGQHSHTGHNMVNSASCAPCYVDTRRNPGECTHVMHDPNTSSTVGPDEWNKTYTETSFSGAAPPNKTLGNTWGGNTYYSDCRGLNMVNDSLNLGQMVYRHPKMCPFGDGYVPFSQEQLYTCNNAGADGHNHSLNMTTPYGGTPHFHSMAYTSTEIPAMQNMDKLDLRGYPGAYSYREQHLDYNKGNTPKYQNNGGALSEHTLIPTVTNTPFVYPNRVMQESHLDDCALSNINLHEIDFINMSDKTWLTLRGAGMFKLGNKGRAILKSKISKQLKTNSQMRMRASLISGVRRATTRQLFQLAQICGIKSHLK